MTVLLFANNASTTLAAPLTSGAGTCSLSPGTGALFPNPGAGQSFRMTFVDAATGLTNEIVACTARSGDVLTITRAQEGTTAKAWIAGDIAAQFNTAGTQANQVQADQLQAGTYQLATSVGGTVNAITATLASGLSALTPGQVVNFIATGANTGAVTFNLTLGSTVIGALPVVNLTGGALSAGDIAGAGYPVFLQYNGTATNWQIQNRAGASIQASVITTKGDLIVGASANTAARLGIGSDGSTPTALAAAANGVAYSAMPFVGGNGCLVASVASNILTIALKNVDGNDATAADPVIIPFRSTSALSGAYSPLAITGASSIAVSSGSSLGAANATPFRVWVVGFNDGGTFRLGVVNCLDPATLTIAGLSASQLTSSTAEGGAGTADSFGVIYTGTAVTSKPMRVLGYFDYASGLTTAGLYASNPTNGTIMSPDVRLPGATMQRVRKITAVTTNSAATMPADNTIPQNTEGSAFGNVLDQAIAPFSAVNVLHVRLKIFWFTNLLNDCLIVTALFRDSGANAVQACMSGLNISGGTASANAFPIVELNYETIAGSTASTSFKMRAGNDAGGGIALNGGTSYSLGGAQISSITIEEIVA